MGLGFRGLEGFSTTSTSQLMQANVLNSFTCGSVLFKDPRRMLQRLTRGALNTVGFQLVEIGIRGLNQSTIHQHYFSQTSEIL